MSLILVKPSIGLTSAEDNGKLRDLRRKHGDIHKLEGLCRSENYQITVLKYKLFNVCANMYCFLMVSLMVNTPVSISF